MNKRLLKADYLKSTKPGVDPERFFLACSVRQSLSNGFRHDVLRSYEQCKIEAADVSNKTILVLGPSKSGRTTFINAMMNSLLEIDFEDCFRYEIEGENGHKSPYPGAKRSLSGGVSSFIGYSFSNKHGYYTIVDTPGIDAVVEDGSSLDAAKLMHVLSSSELKYPFYSDKFKSDGQVVFDLKKIHAVCFVDSSPDAGLPTFTQFMMSRFLNLFENAAGGNVFLVKTFGNDRNRDSGFEGGTEDLSFQQVFTVDNGVLFALKNTFDAKSSSTWNDSMSACRSILDFVTQSQSPAILKSGRANTKAKAIDVEQAVIGLQEMTDKLLYQSANLDRERAKLNNMKQELNAMKETDVYSVVTQEKIKVPKPTGRNVTVCFVCSYTCHDDCVFANNEEKGNCAAMNRFEPNIEKRHCTVCRYRCHWRQHANTPYYFEAQEKSQSFALGTRLEEFRIKSDDVEKGEKLVQALQLSLTKLLLDMMSKMDEIDKFKTEVSHLDTTGHSSQRMLKERLVLELQSLNPKEGRAPVDFLFTILFLMSKTGTKRLLLFKTYSKQKFVFHFLYDSSFRNSAASVNMHVMFSSLK